MRSVSLVMSDWCDEWVFPKWAWSGSREQFLHCGLRKFCHSKSSVYRWYTQLNRRRFVYDIYVTMKATRMHMFITHRLTLTLQLQRLLYKSFCTFAWQLARFQLTRRIARSIGDSWASCTFLVPAHPGSPWKRAVKWTCVCVVLSCIAHSFYNCVFHHQCILSDASFTFTDSLCHFWFCVLSVFYISIASVCTAWYWYRMLSVHQMLVLC